MASSISASKMQDERCSVSEAKEEMVGLTVSVSQGDRSPSPTENKKPASIGKKPELQYSREQLMELRKHSTNKQAGGDVIGEDDVGGTSAPVSREGDNSQPPEGESEQKTVSTSGKKPKYQYTREQLMELRNHPLSRQKPSIPNNDAPPFHRSRGWDQDQWHHGSRHENSIEEDRGGRGDGPHETHKRRPGDPRERLRKEQDGIVLSPQRRSFNSGCFVIVTPQQQQQQQQQQSSQHQQTTSSRRPDSPLGKGEREGHREIAPNRRIGSGRIINRERDREYWVDFRVDREKDPDGDFSGFRGMRDRDRDERTMRSERRPFGRDFDRDRDTGFGGSGNGGAGDRGSVGGKGSSERSSGRSGRYGNDRRRSYSDSRGEEEPEWFSGGPTSQHDTIELRGFEDIPEESVAPNSGGHTTLRSKKQAQNSKSGPKSGGSKTALSTKKSPHGSGKTSPSLPPTSEAPLSSSEKEHNEKGIQHSPKISKPSSPNSNVSSNKAALNQIQQHQPPNASGSGDFNLEDFLKMDSIPGLLTNGASTEGPIGGGSRFSQWFRRESPPPIAAAMIMMSNQQNQLGENSTCLDASNKAPGGAVSQPADSRRSSLQDELLNNIINEITEPNIVIPSLGGPDSYFAPISPAASTTIGSGVRAQDQDSSSKSSLLLEMLHRGNSQQRPQRQQQQPDGLAPGMMKPPSIKELEVAGKLHSVEELEARLRQSSAVGSGGHSSGPTRNVAPGGGRGRAKGDGTDSDTPASGQSEEDMTAFKKLLAQVSGGQAVPAANGVGQHFGILQMLGKKDTGSAQQSNNLAHQPGGAASGVPNPNDPGILGGLLGGSGGLTSSPAQLGAGPSASRPSPMQHSMIPPDLVMRLLQVQQQQHHQHQLQRHQQEWLTKLAGAQPQQPNQQPMAHMQPPHHSHIPHLHHGAQAQGVSQRVQGQLGPLTGIPNLPASPTPSTSLSPLPPELQMVINQTQPGRDLLQRPESQNIMRGLGTAAPPPHQAPMSSQQQQVAAAVAVAAAAAAAASASPRASSPHTDFIHQILLQQQQQQMRIPSPLNNAYCQQPRVLSPSTPVHLATASGPANNTNQPLVTSPIAPNHPNTLAIQHAAGMAPHRVPSPRELRAHTQQIMHAALIKKKLEEQKENYRRRQEMQQQSHSPNLSTAGNKMESSTPPAKHSPTPLAFTPTSVLRKMTAEKDPLASSEGPSIMSNSMGKADMKNQASADNKSQQSQILAMSNQGQQQSSNQWKNDSHVKVQQGRAIVKGGGGANAMSSQYGSLMDYQSQKMGHIMENHSQPQASSNLMQNAGHGMHGGQYAGVGNRAPKSIPRTGGVSSGAGAGMSANTVHPQFMKPPVMLLRPTGVNAAAAAARVQSLQTQMAGMQNRGTGGGTGNRMNSGGFSIPHGLSPSLQQLLLSQNSYVGMGGNMGGPVGVDRTQHPSSLGVKSGNSSGRPGSTTVSAQSTSPTNQLARWFSPELLAQARAGKLPDMPPVSTQRALSLEEVERLQQAATSVRN